MPIFKEISARDAVKVFLDTDEKTLFYASPVTEGEIVSIKPEQVLLRMFRDNSVWQFFVPYELQELVTTGHGVRASHFVDAVRSLGHNSLNLTGERYEVIIREIPSDKVVSQESVKEFLKNL